MTATTKICSVSGCGKPVHPNGRRWGLCNAHGLRMRRRGTVEYAHMPGHLNHCKKNPCPGAAKLWNHIEYIRNKDLYKQRAEKWRDENPARYRATLRAYLDRPETQDAARLRTKKWTRDNPERKRAMDRAFSAANPALVVSYKAKRRASVRHATPPWLTDDMELQMRTIYDEARRLTELTGIPHDVDHIAPIAGKMVSGLHLPHNLRPMPRVENNRRPRVWGGKMRLEVERQYFLSLKLRDL